MLRIAIVFVVLWGALAGALAGPDQEGAVRDLYDRFAAAQNAHDVPAVRDLLLDSPRFLWVSNGMSYWGPETMVERMATFQRAEVWQVEPALDQAVFVPVNASAAYLHLPLTLVIGRAAAPDRLRFLVSMLAVDTDAGWRIAALFTTTANPG
ncbi:MAG: nuclear transport factor 2 family protein [Alphaproteobacteria bacterium]